MTDNALPASRRFDQDEPGLLIRFRPAWECIEKIREFGRFFCVETFSEPQVAERVRVMIQELLENAVKYSDCSQLAEFELTASVGSRQLRMSVCSAPSPEHLDRLKRALDLLHVLEPEAAYLAAFERVAREPSATTRLGLARLRYECNAELSVSEESDGRIRVAARVVV